MVNHLYDMSEVVTVGILRHLNNFLRNNEKGPRTEKDKKLDDV